MCKVAGSRRCYATWCNHCHRCNHHYQTTPLPLMQKTAHTTTSHFCYLSLAHLDYNACDDFLPGCNSWLLHLWMQVATINSSQGKYHTNNNINNSRKEWEKEKLNYVYVGEMQVQVRTNSHQPLCLFQLCFFVLANRARQGSRCFCKLEGFLGSCFFFNFFFFLKFVFLISNS